MLRKIPANLSPELVKTLMEMGHGDEILLADANFPGHHLHPRTIRADGLGIPELLRSVLELMPLDRYSSYQVALMQTVGDDPRPPGVGRLRADLDRGGAGGRAGRRQDH